MAVINELGGEKIDVIAFDEKPEKLLQMLCLLQKLYRCKLKIKTQQLFLCQQTSFLWQLEKTGRNVRLAAQLTGWKIDIKTKDVPAEEIEGEPAESPSDNQAGEAAASKPKKNGLRSPPAKNGESFRRGKTRTDGEAVEESPAEVNAETEELPADNPTEK